MLNKSVIIADNDSLQSDSTFENNLRKILMSEFRNSFIEFQNTKEIDRPSSEDFNFFFRGRQEFYRFSLIWNNASSDATRSSQPIAISNPPVRQ